MRPNRVFIPGALLVLVLALLTACGTNAAPPPTPRPTSPATSATAAGPASPSPTAAAPAQPTRPAEAVLSSRVAYPWHWPNDAGRPATIQHSYPVPPLPRALDRKST